MKSFENYLIKFSVSALSPHPMVISLLLAQSQDVIIVAGVCIVVVSQFREVRDSTMGHLEDGDADCHVVGSLKVVPILILQIGLRDIQEKLHVEGPQVAGDKGVSSVGIVLFRVVRIGT